MTDPNDEWSNPNFRRRRRQDQDEFDWVKWLGIAAAVIAIAMLLIEWNARRQAAAQVREWTRPITPDLQAKIDESLHELQRQSDADMARIQRDMQQSYPTPRRQVDQRPLAADERCISHQRFQRIENGWNQIGTC